MTGTSSDENAVDNRLEETARRSTVWAPCSPERLVAARRREREADGRRQDGAAWNVRRAYRQILLNELDLVHPGIATVHTDGLRPRDRFVLRFVSAVNSTANVGVDHDMSAPRSDTFSIGLDRQITSQVAVNVSYVRKRGNNLIGWRDIGGQYAEGTALLPDGRSLPVLRLVNPSQRRSCGRIGRVFRQLRWFRSQPHEAVVKPVAGTVNLTLSTSEGMRLAGNVGRIPMI